LKRDAEGRTDPCLREKRHIVKKLIICKEKPMPELSHIDPRSAALLVMDYQVDTLTRFMTAATLHLGRRSNRGRAQ
jgi:hypothetical protein